MNERQLPPTDAPAGTASESASDGASGALSANAADEALTAQALREHAEAVLGGRAAARAERQAALSPEAVRQALHELQVHQIELEMQNDELRRAQLELEASRARYFDLYDLAPVGYCIVSAQGLILQANLAAAALFGVARGALTRQPFSRFVLAADADRWQLCRRQLAAAGAPQTLELRLARPDTAPGVAGLTGMTGAPVATVQVSASAALDADATPVLRVVLTDVTERKRTEAALRASEANYRALFDSSLDAILLTAPDGRILHANAAACRLFARTEAELKLGGRGAVVDLSDPRLAAGLAERARTGHFSGELSFIRQGGARFAGEVSTSVFQDADGQARTSMIVRDVSLRTQARDALQASLREKEALLKEVHHRVKNNLQVIHSLLRLETGRNPQPEVKQVLRAMQARIVSMALLHETLYRSGSFAAVDLGHYLQQLATQAFQAQAAGHGAVTLQLALASAQVTMDQAVACGLLVNELVSNSLKHAFPDGRAGTLRVALRSLASDAADGNGNGNRNADGDGDALSLCVSDDGVGLPADFGARRGESLGLQLVADLAQQLGASLRFGAEHGSAVELIFTPQRAQPAADFPGPAPAHPPAHPPPDPTLKETAP